MSLKDLSYKLATLLALVTVSRSSDLVLLSVDHYTSTREGVKFVLNGLSKQSRPNHIRPPLLVQKYKEDSLICPVECFMTYVSRTDKFRSGDSQGLVVPAQLFLGISRPHARACSIARWIKCTLSSAGIDTREIFSPFHYGSNNLKGDGRRGDTYRSTPSKRTGPQQGYFMASIFVPLRFHPWVFHQQCSHQLVRQSTCWYRSGALQSIITEWLKYL